MKRILLILMLVWSTLLVSAGIHTYTRQSVLNQGNWIKIRIDQTGVYKMSYEQLIAAGISSPSHVRIYGYGGAQKPQNFSIRNIDDLPCVPFYMETGADGVFGQGDYILFYAQGPIRWDYQSAYTHTRNTYSNYGYYFLSDNAGEQRLLTPAAAPVSTSATAITTYTQLHVVDHDSINLINPAGKEGGGKIWYGESFKVGHLSQRFSFPTHHLCSEWMNITIDVASTSSHSSVFTASLGAKSTSVKVDSVISSNNDKARAANMVLTAMPDGTGSQTMTLSYSAADNTAIGYLNYIELRAEAQLRMQGAWMPIYKYHNTLSTAHYRLLGATPSTQVWDVSELDHIRRMGTTLKSDTLEWTVTPTVKDQRFVLVNTDANNWLSPVVVGPVANQNLHRYDNIDMVIICPESMRHAAERLAEAHAERDGLVSIVVTDQQVYNEFSSGTPDASAYRWMMKMLYDRAQADATILPPSYLLLMGDGSFDNRALLTTSGNHTLLTYQANNSVNEVKAYATDDYFGFMLDSEGESDTRGKMKIAVGRIPAATTEEAEAYVNKAIRYMDDEHKGKWKQQLLFLADDGDHGLHTQVSEAGAEPTRQKNPSLIINKLYMDSYIQQVGASGESYPMAQLKLTNYLNNGILFFDYSGHGGFNTITSENMMDRAFIQSLNNENMAFWMFATCNFAHFDASEECAAEVAVLNPYGGAIGVISASRTVYANENNVINQNICNYLFEHADPCDYHATIGQAIASAKNSSGQTVNKLSYVYLGDPALRLPFPTQYQILTDVHTAPDTIHALSLVDFSGYVADEEGNPVTDFNGPLEVSVFDKLQVLHTLDNDEPDPAQKKFVEYKDYPNRIFSGKTMVKDGAFKFRFMAPKDIRYNYGNGRITYYAYDTISGAEGIGHYEDFVVGGSSMIEIDHTTGPEIGLYLNNPLWKDGELTHPHPHLYAHLYDEYGINTIGSGIGHDLLLTIDNDPNQSYVLNDYYESYAGSYQEGIISYPMMEQSEGTHFLTLRAWDMLNNSSTAMLNFGVSSSLQPQLYQVIVYPNPVSVTDYLHFPIEHDRPDEVLQTELFIYDLSGRLITSLTQRGTQTISFTPTSMGMTTGIYMGRVTITNHSGAQHASGYIKIIVKQ